MAGTGFDALMIREADAGLKDRLGTPRLRRRRASRAIGRDAVRTRVRGRRTDLVRGAATCVLVGNMGDVIGGISAFPDARPDDGRAERRGRHGRRASWTGRARSAGRRSATPASSPFVETTTADDDRRAVSRRRRALRARRRRPPEDEATEFRVEPAAITVCVPDEEEER